MYLYQYLNMRPLTIDGYRTAIVDTLGPVGPTFLKALTLTGYSPAFTGIVPKFLNPSRVEPSVVLNELTQAPLSL